MPVSNAIMTIRPYLYYGTWVFDDENTNLYREAFVAGMPEIIETMLREQCVDNWKVDGFVALFSAEKFPGSHDTLTWVREEACGNTYKLEGTALEGWLCPALFAYFDEAPACIHIQVKNAVV